MVDKITNEKLKNDVSSCTGNPKSAESSCTGNDQIANTVESEPKVFKCDICGEVMLFLIQGSEYQPLEYQKHFKIKLFKVRILNGLVFGTYYMIPSRIMFSFDVTTRSLITH